MRKTIDGKAYDTETAADREISDMGHVDGRVVYQSRDGQWRVVRPRYVNFYTDGSQGEPIEDNYVVIYQRDFDADGEEWDEVDADEPSVPRRTLAACRKEEQRIANGQ